MRFFIRGQGVWRVPMIMTMLAAFVYADISLSTPFVDVVMSPVQVGTTIEVMDSHGWPLIVNNNSREYVKVLAASRMPKHNRLLPGYEAIPDAEWIVIDPEIPVVIPPGGSATFHVMLTVPYDRSYMNRHYQGTVLIRGRSMDGRDIAIGGGLRTRLNFSTYE